MDGVGQVGVVLGRDAGDGDAAVLGQVDGELLGETLNLLLVEAGEAEHADLVGDVLPVVNRALLSQVLHQAAAHCDDSVGHALHLAQPQGVELGCVEHLGGDLGAVSWRIRVHAANGDAQLAEHTLDVVLVRQDEGESTDTLTVQAHVLRERLRDDVLVAILGEETSGICVPVGITAAKALIGRVQEWKQLSLLYSQPQK